MKCEVLCVGGKRTLTVNLSHGQNRHVTEIFITLMLRGHVKHSDSKVPELVSKKKKSGSEPSEASSAVFIRSPFVRL